MNSIHFIKKINNSDGSILALGLFSLLVLSVLGTFALNTSDIEVSIAANQQAWEKNFNISEGGATIQSPRVGYTGTNGTHPWFQISDPTSYPNPLLPTSLSDYDPSQSDAVQTNDDLATGFTVPSTQNEKFTAAANPDSWPRDNLISDINDDLYDYAYLVTYLGSQSLPGKAYGASRVDAYHFKLNGRRKVHIELGGKKIGPANTW